MYAVFRQTQYSPGVPVHRTPEFREFQQVHAECSGYRGTVVADVGDGRLLTVTLWQTAGDMQAARQALGPVVGRLLDPLMTAPSILLGTGEVLVNDLSGSRDR